MDGAAKETSSYDNRVRYYLFSISAFTRVFSALFLTHFCFVGHLDRRGPNLLRTEMGLQRRAEEERRISS
jgi:hypothetical protein